MIQATQIRRGMIIKYESEPYSVMDVAHVAPGNWRAMVVCKLRNLNTGNSKELRFRSTEKFEEAELEEVEMEYLYSADNKYHFMNTENYEQIELDAEMLGDQVTLLTPNIRVRVEYYEGKPFGVRLPKTVVLKVVETAASIKDATVQAQMKPAVLEGGHKCSVPPFISAGDMVKIDTTTGEYLERA